MSYVWLHFYELLNANVTCFLPKRMSTQKTMGVTRQLNKLKKTNQNCPSDERY